MTLAVDGKELVQLKISQTPSKETYLVWPSERMDSQWMKFGVDFVMCLKMKPYDDDMSLV